MTDGNSMLPAIPPRSVLVVDRFFYKFSGLNPGDVIIAKSPVKKDLDICKRLIVLDNSEYYVDVP